ncbi:MAG TPA: glycosyltransferase, partial [Thermomicrobiales bacterium]|nr:glycosyltransferase [Thermomicrobiales bacterium]
MPVLENSVHVIIVNFRTPALTIGAVESLLARRVPGYDLTVWLVDNGSDDGSATILRERFPDLRLIVS